MPDWLVEPRDPTGTRSADPAGRWATLTVVERYNVPGSWQLTGPLDALRSLLTPGTGAVISRGGDQVMSGPVTRVDRRGDGTAVITGASDLLWLADRIVYPNPAQAITAQTAGTYTASGARETLILALIGLNAGPAALAARRVARLRLPTTAGRGGTAAVTARLDNLLTLTGQLAEAGALRIDAAHAEDGGGRWIDVAITAVADLSATVRFGPAEEGGPGRLTDDWSYAIGAPTVTRAVAAGGGELAARVFRERPDAGAEALWGRRVEALVDQRQTTDTGELDQAGDDALIAGAGPVEVSATALDSPDLAYRTGWRAGDKVALTLDGTDVVDVVREVTTTVGVQQGQQTEQVVPSVGSPDASTNTVPSQRALTAALRRIAALEARQ